MDLSENFDYIRTKSISNKDILLEIEEMAKKDNVPIIKPETARFLEVMCAVTNPVRILEVGTAIGYSSIVMADALDKNVLIDTIEINRSKVIIARKNVLRFGFDNSIRVIYGNATEVLKCLNTQYDMIFMDAAKGQYIEFLPECIRLLKHGGMLITDNIFCQGLVLKKGKVARRKRTMVRKVDQYVEKLFCKGLKTSLIGLADGIALSIKVSESMC